MYNLKHQKMTKAENEICDYLTRPHIIIQLFHELTYKHFVSITNIPEHKYSVLFVDYGNRQENVNYDRLRDMPDTILFMEPMCVQQCYLAGIMPPDRGRELVLHSTVLCIKQASLVNDD